MAFVALDHDFHVTVTVLSVDESGPNVHFETALAYPDGVDLRAIGTLLMYTATQLLEEADE